MASGDLKKSKKELGHKTDYPTDYAHVQRRRLLITSTLIMIILLSLIVLNSQAVSYDRSTRLCYHLLFLYYQIRKWLGSLKL